MTISEQLTALQQDITNARTAITNMGGTVTTGGGSSQLATDIATITTSSDTPFTTVSGNTEHTLDSSQVKYSYYNTTISTYTQPSDLTSDGTLGEGDFAVSATNLGSGNEAYIAINNYSLQDTSKGWHSSSEGKTHNFIIYVAAGIKISQLIFKNRTNGGSTAQYPDDVTVYASNDNSSYVEIGTGTNDDKTIGGTWTATIDSTSQDYYIYYKLVFTSGGNYMALNSIGIVGTQRTRTAGTPSSHNEKVTSASTNLVIASNMSTFETKYSANCTHDFTYWNNSWLLDDGSAVTLADYGYQVTTASSVNTKQTQITTFTQPVLTANGTMGGDDFACSQSAYYSDKTKAFACFNGDSTTSGENNRWQINGVSGYQWISWYNPNPLNITQLDVTNNEANYVIADYIVQGSDDNETWTDIVSGTNSDTTAMDTWTIDMSSNSTYYNYHRIYCTANSSSSLQVSEITITGSENAAQSITTNLQTFTTAVNNVSGTYTFIHNGTNWTLNGNAVDLATYGMDTTEVSSTNNIVAVFIGTTNFVNGQTVTAKYRTDTPDLFSYSNVSVANYTIVGSGTVTADYKFTPVTDSYLVPTDNFTLGAKDTWEFRLKYTHNSDVEGYFFGSITDYKSPKISTNYIYINSYNNSGWNIASTSYTGNWVVGTTYYVKIGCENKGSGSHYYYIDRNTTGWDDSFDNVWNKTVSASSGFSEQPIIGNAVGLSTPLSGTLDLAECSLIQNGEVISKFVNTSSKITFNKVGGTYPALKVCDKNGTTSTLSSISDFTVPQMGVCEEMPNLYQNGTVGKSSYACQSFASSTSIWQVFDGDITTYGGSSGTGYYTIYYSPYVTTVEKLNIIFQNYNFTTTLNISTSLDGGTWTEVFNESITVPNTQKYVNEIICKPSKCRYIKITPSNGNQNYYYEIRIFNAETQSANLLVDSSGNVDCTRGDIIVTNSLPETQWHDNVYLVVAGDMSTWTCYKNGEPYNKVPFAQIELNTDNRIVSAKVNEYKQWL